jgi:multidrug resistance protein, MATE family
MQTPDERACGSACSSAAKEAGQAHPSTVGSDLYSILFYLGAGTLGGLAPFYTAAIVASDPAERARIEAAGRAIVALLALALVPVVWSAPA